MVELPFAQATGVVYVSADVPAGAAICWPLPIPHSDSATEIALESLAAALGTDGAAQFEAVVAYVKEHLDRLVPPPASYLPVLGMHPAVQGRGIGTDLIRAFFAWAVADHLTACWATWRRGTLPSTAGLAANWLVKAWRREPIGSTGSFAGSQIIPNEMTTDAPVKHRG